MEFIEGNTSITVIMLQEREVVPLSNPVAVTTNEEVWLANLTSVMHHTLHLLLEVAPTTAQRKDWSIDPTKFPSQVLGHKNMYIVMSRVHYGWGSFLDVLCLFLWSSTVVCQLMLNLCTLVRVLISTPLGFWYLHYVTVCNVSPALP